MKMEQSTKQRLELLLGFRLTRAEVDILRNVEENLDYQPIQKPKRIRVYDILERLNDKSRMV